ncbi:MAG: hypothetical protein COB73_02835 [Flavobacteriaceae bacterium]|nr:MAG: hypothetical protein COB73_02835 [Flavobacteriaceae bacterium]
MFYILILFFVGIVAIYFLAKAILKFVPKKVQPVITILLYGVAAYLAFLSYQSVMEPIHFNKEKEQRYAKVINSLKIIRDAQAAHRTVIGDYAKKGEDLIKFIDTAQFAVTKDTNIVVTVNLGGGLTGEEEVMRTDTIGYTDVRAAFVGRDYKNMLNVPGTDKQFELNTGMVQKSHGDMRKVFEAKVDKAVVLEGLNPDLIRSEKKTEDNDQVKGTHIRVGSMTDVSDSGNWPPSYDIADMVKAKKQ